MVKRHCEEPGRAFVWIVTAQAATVAKVVEGCVYLHRRYYAILACFGRSSSSPLRSASLFSSLSPNTTTINNLIRWPWRSGHPGLDSTDTACLSAWPVTYLSPVFGCLWRAHENKQNTPLVVRSTTLRVQRTLIPAGRLLFCSDLFDWIYAPYLGSHQLYSYTCTSSRVFVFAARHWYKLPPGTQRCHRYTSYQTK